MSNKQKQKSEDFTVTNSSFKRQQLEDIKFSLLLSIEKTLPGTSMEWESAKESKNCRVAIERCILEVTKKQVFACAVHLCTIQV